MCNIVFMFLFFKQVAAHALLLNVAANAISSSFIGLGLFQRHAEVILNTKEFPASTRAEPILGDENFASSHTIERGKLSHDALISSVNSRWETGKPSHNLTEAGLLIHVLDGYGIWPDGMMGESWRGDLPPPGDVLWSWLGQLTAAVETSDRVSASIINKGAPYMYEPKYVKKLVSHGFGQLPFVVLQDSKAVTSRLSCCYPSDASTSDVMCDHTGEDSGCIPGCRSQSGAEWWEIAATLPERLEDCLAGMSIDASCETSLDVICGNNYNEVILDSFRGGGWQVSSMVAAIGIAHDASDEAFELARQVHAAAKIDIPGLPPLLTYNKLATKMPFRRS